MAGLTPQGFQIKTLDEIQKSIAENLRIGLGPATNTTPSSRIGQFIDIISNELFSLWLGLENTYNAYYPDSASGTSLDNVVAITNTVRNNATAAQGQVFFQGDDAVVVPNGTLVANSNGNAFSTQAAITLSKNASFIIAAGVATGGSVTLRVQLNNSTYSQFDIFWDDTPAEIKNTIQLSVSEITTCTVVGSFNTSGAFHVVLDVSTLVNAYFDPLVSFLVNGVTVLPVTSNFSNVDSALVIGAQTGPLSVPVRSINVVVNTITNLDAVLNIRQGTTGTNRESDADLRARRLLELQKVGTATTGGIKEAVSQVINVSSVSIIENDSSTTDTDGRPPHSFEIFVIGGNNDTIAQTIYDSKPIGINVTSTVSPGSQRSGSYIDVNGVPSVIIFSAPDPVPMLVAVNITIDVLVFPTDGADQIKYALLKWFEQYELGDDVLNHMLYSPVNTVPGIKTLTILQDKGGGGGMSAANTAIAPTEVAQLSANDIIVTIT